MADARLGTISGGADYPCIHLHTGADGVARTSGKIPNMAHSASRGLSAGAVVLHYTGVLA